MSIKKQNFITAYLHEAWEEFNKVTWPTKEQAALLTGIVVAASTVAALIIALYDLGLNELYQLLLNAF